MLYGVGGCRCCMGEGADAVVWEGIDDVVWEV